MHKTSMIILLAKKSQYVNKIRLFLNRRLAIKMSRKNDTTINSQTCLIDVFYLYFYRGTHFNFLLVSLQMEVLEEFRRERIDELATMIQKLWRGHHTREKWNKLHKSQMVISNCWKQWKDKSHIEEERQRRLENEAAFVIQKTLKSWQVNH